MGIDAPNCWKGAQLGSASPGCGDGRVSERDRRSTSMATVHIGLTYPDLIAHIAPGDLAERAERWGAAADVPVNPDVSQLLNAP